MRATILVTAVGLVLAGCASGSDAGSGASPSPQVDERRMQIYASVVRSLVEFPDQTVYVWTRLCSDADGAAQGTRCQDSLTPAEQAALADLLADDVGEIRFVEDTSTVSRDIFDGEGGELVRLGPIDEVNGEVRVPGMHQCGNLCGGGSVWVVDETGAGWEVKGPVEGHGVWIS